jgi:hypothetical protein
VSSEALPFKPGSDLEMVPLPAEVARAILTFVREHQTGSFTLHFSDGDLKALDERRTRRIKPPTARPAGR